VKPLLFDSGTLKNPDVFRGSTSTVSTVRILYVFCKMWGGRKNKSINRGVPSRVIEEERERRENSSYIHTYSIGLPKVVL
jgi:hypothetical protein